VSYVPALFPLSQTDNICLEVAVFLFCIKDVVELVVKQAIIRLTIKHLGILHYLNIYDIIYSVIRVNVHVF
jgi:hypothetical protein